MDSVLEKKDLYIQTEKEIMMLLEICTSSGAILLRNGAEVYRVEDTVERIIKSRKNVRDADVYSTLNVVIISFNVNGHIYSNVRRVKERGNNLVFVDKVNTFSRDFVNGKYSLEEALLELEKIKNYKGTGLPLITMGAALSGAAFTGLIGGKLPQAFTTFLVGVLAWLLHTRFSKMKLGYFIDSFINGILVGSLSIIFTKIFKVGARDLIIISSMMAYLPGITLTNSIRDLLTGDTTTGLTGIAQAVLVSTALALGVALSLAIGG